MTATSLPAYPRPDFVRPDLVWESLNGPWDFLFDDDDVGLERGWHRSGLPERVEVRSGNGASQSAATITQKIAALPEKLIRDNVFRKSGDEGGKVHERRSIEVPFVFQTPASGIEEKGAHEVFWYERQVADIRRSKATTLLLRFGAVDYEATVWVNGQYVGDHRGGHVPFDIDISDAVASSRATTDGIRLTVRVRDSPSDLTQPRGKQYWAPQPESIFYTPSSGIWQSVWLEDVPPARIGDGSYGTVLRSNDIKSGMLHATIAVIGRRAGHAYTVQVESKFNGKSLQRAEQKLPHDANEVNLSIDMQFYQSEDVSESAPASQKPSKAERARKGHLFTWFPETPNLYDITITLRNAADEPIDEVNTTVGMRSIEWRRGDGTFLLNDQPYFQALVLDQGYWPRTNITPPRPDACRRDIEMSKAMGFNGCRKHQKVEDPMFLYWADKLGYIVWGEMANAYRFSSTYVERFNAEWIAAVKRDINHPCVVAWTPVNESWAYTDLKGDVEQRNHIRQLYHLTKTVDPTRPVNDNCGWEHVLTDLTTFHDYSDAVELSKTAASMVGILGTKAGRQMFVGPIYRSTSGVADEGARHTPGAPVICTEFGGVNIKPGKAGEGEQAGERDWGYTTADDPEDLRKRIEGLALGLVRGGHCCGFVYTQLTDIEQETNGVYTYDRRAKLDPSKVKAIMDAAKALYYDIQQDSP